MKRGACGQCRMAQHSEWNGHTGQCSHEVRIGRERFEERVKVAPQRMGAAGPEAGALARNPHGLVQRQDSILFERGLRAEWAQMGGQPNVGAIGRRQGDLPQRALGAAKELGQ